MLALLVPATSAFAHHPEITASVDCAGLVTYTSTAWAGPDVASRTNGNIGITVTVGTPNPASGAYAAPGFSFSGSFSIAPGTSTTVTATANGPWGNGTAGGDSRSATATAPNNCVPVDVCPDALNPGNQPTGTVCITPPPVCTPPTTGTPPNCVTPPVTEPPVTEPPVTEPPVTEPPVEIDRPNPPLSEGPIVNEPVERFVETTVVHRGELPYTGNDEVILIAILGAALIGGGLYLHRRGRGNGDV